MSAGLATAIKNLRWRRGLSRLWLLLAVPTAAICIGIAAGNYLEDRRKASNTPTWSEIERACVIAVERIRRDGLPVEDGPSYRSYLAWKVQEEYGHIVNLPPASIAEACAAKGRADGVQDRAALSPSVMTAILSALVWFGLIAVAVPLAITLIAAATFILLRWIARGFAP